MKTLRYIAAALFVFVLAFATTAEARRTTPQTAANKSSRVQSIKESVVGDGYKLDGVHEQQIYYIAAPKAPYAWGTLVYTYSRPADNGTMDQVEVTVAVQYTETGYAFPEITIREHVSE